MNHPNVFGQIEYIYTEIKENKDVYLFQLKSILSSFFSRLLKTVEHSFLKLLNR